MKKLLIKLGSHSKKFFADASLIIGITSLFLIVGHFAIGGGRTVKHSLLGVKTKDALTEQVKTYPTFVHFEGYKSYFEDAARANKMEVQPYYHWRRAPVTTNSVNIDEKSIRRTIKQPNPNAKKVFMFGGSTMWGTGTPDQYTIPSQLQALLGSDYDVYNFGETAFVSVQELNLLLEQLANDHRPDIVIFYDGVNDGYAGLYSPGKPRHPQFTQEDYKSVKTVPDLLIEMLKRTNYIAVLVRIDKLFMKDTEGMWEKKVMPELTENAKKLTQNYAHLIKQVKALGKEYGFKTYHFWQPLLLTEQRQLTAFEQEIYNKTSKNLTHSYQVLYQTAKQQLTKEDNFHYLAEIFTNTTDPIFFDFCHMGPLGNQMIAKAMYDKIKEG